MDLVNAVVEIAHDAEGKEKNPQDRPRAERRPRKIHLRYEEKRGQECIEIADVFF